MEQFLVEGRAAVGVVAMGLDLAQVVAGAEHRPLGGDDDRFDRAIPRDLLEGDEQRVDHQQAQRIAGGDGSQGDRRHARAVVAANQGGAMSGHWCRSFGRCERFIDPPAPRANRPHRESAAENQGSPNFPKIRTLAPPRPPA